MTDYTKSTNFATKDSLSSGNALKILKGTEIDTEFNNIQTAIATKADLTSPTFTGTPLAPTASTSTSTTQIATTAFVQAVANAMFPVGSIYTNAAVSTNPATLLGFGTWAAFGTGRVLVGVDSGDAAFDTLGETGGSKDAVTVSHTHTFTATSGSMSANATHSHTTTNTYYTPDGAAGTFTRGGSANFTGATGVNSANTDHTHSVSGTTDTTGSSGTNANLPPYITVYMWRRTA